MIKHKQFNLPNEADERAKEERVTFTDHKQFNLPPQASETAREATEKAFELSAPNINRTDKDLNIKNLHRVTDTETAVIHGQKIKVTEILSGATNTHFTQLNEFNIGIKDVTISRGVQLPKSSLAGLGKIYVVKDMSGSASATTITIAPIDGETLDGEPTQSITSDWGVKRVFSDGSNWFTY
jgi:hypothetical protein